MTFEKSRGLSPLRFKCLALKRWEDNFKRESKGLLQTNGCSLQTPLSKIYLSKISSRVSQTPVIWGTVLWEIFLVQETPSWDFLSSEIWQEQTWKPAGSGPSVTPSLSGDHQLKSRHPTGCSRYSSFTVSLRIRPWISPLPAVLPFKLKPSVIASGSLNTEQNGEKSKSIKMSNKV